MIRKYEAENNMDEDLCAGCFGRIMACLFTPKNDVWKPRLKRLGFYLGKYIYLLDAYCDIEHDIRHNCYNPLKDTWYDADADFSSYCEQLLRMMIAQSARAFEELPLLRDAELMRNILYAGVWSAFAANPPAEKATTGDRKPKS